MPQKPRKKPTEGLSRAEVALYNEEFQKWAESYDHAAWKALSEEFLAEYRARGLDELEKRDPTSEAFLKEFEPLYDWWRKRANELSREARKEFESHRAKIRRAAVANRKAREKFEEAIRAAYLVEDGEPIMSLSEIAKAAGLSKTRVHEIINRKEEQ
jgi:hypothetical protein